MQTESTNTMATGRITKKILDYIEKINKHVEDMALNKVNIEFLRKQMDKVLEDMEKLKDANREIKYNGNGTNN